MTFIRNIAKNVYGVIGNIKTILNMASKGYLHDNGFFNSFSKRADLSGNSNPWFVYSCVNFLANKLKPNQVVFEFGSGASTVFFSNRVARVVSIEHDEKWYKTIQNLKLSNVDLIMTLGNMDEYVSKIVGEKPDVVIIDGLFRNECAMMVTRYIADDGVIIFDDTDRRNEYSIGLKHLYDNGFKELRFEGLSAGSIYLNSTSVFYRPINIFNI